MVLSPLSQGTPRPATASVSSMDTADLVDLGAVTALLLFTVITTISLVLPWLTTREWEHSRGLHGLGVAPTLWEHSHRQHVGLDICPSHNILCFI